MSPSCPAMDTSLLQNPRKWNDKLNSKGRCQWDLIWELSDFKGKKVPAECNSPPPFSVKQMRPHIGEMEPHQHITCLCTRHCRLKRHLYKRQSTTQCSTILPFIWGNQKTTWSCTIYKETKLHGQKEDLQKTYNHL